MSEIAPSYLDVWQREHKLDPETRRTLEKALGPQPKGKIPPVRIERAPCRQPEVLAGGGRIWGFMVQLYGIRSERNWGVGDFTDLRTLVELAASLGAGVVGVNPLHAAFVSPYSPSSRHALNTVYLDIESIPEFGHCREAQQLTKSRAFLSRLLKLRKAELVDYDGVRAAKYEVLEHLYACFRKDRTRRRGGVVGPGFFCHRRLDGRAARGIQSARAGLGSTAVLPASAARRALPAIRRSFARQ